MRNLHHRFVQGPLKQSEVLDLSYVVPLASQIYGGDFAKLFGFSEYMNFIRFVVSPLLMLLLLIVQRCG